MKDKMKQIIVFIIILMLFHSNIAYSVPLSQDKDKIPNLTKTVIVIDNDLETPLPKRFRAIEDLNISGSQQFTPLQLSNIIKEIKSPNITIVDLRQEAHGFLNDMAVSYHNNSVYPFSCYNSRETLKIEKYLFSNVKIGDKINLYRITGELNKSIVVEKRNIEEKLVKSLNVKYVLFAVRDGSIPTPTMVDKFVDFIKNKNNDEHLHFHCKEGEGRTTTFMSLYQMMNNRNNLSLDQILQQQLDAGGIELTVDNKGRADFLQNFYDYVDANKDSNYEIPYSKWIINSNMAA